MNLLMYFITIGSTKLTVFYTRISFLKLAFSFYPSPIARLSVLVNLYNYFSSYSYSSGRFGIFPSTISKDNGPIE